MKAIIKKITAITAGILLVISMVGCTAPADSSSVSQDQEPSSVSETSPEDSSSEAAPEMLDRNGMPYEVPEKAEKIISLSPAATEILIGLGLEENIIGIDYYSMDAFEDQTAAAALESFDMLAPSAEQAIALGADIIIASGLSYYEGGNPLEVVTEHGTFITDIPTAVSIDGVREDIKFIGSITGKDAEAAALIEEMDTKIESITTTIGDAASGKVLYFEMGSDPALYSLGADTFINEFIELIGCTNAFADQSGWISVQEETVIAANPDIIFTNDMYTEDAVGEIKSRSGWEVVTAVAGEQVFFVDANASSRPSQNIVFAMEEMAKAVYPDLFA